jgi:hypothetical protein
VPWRADDIVVLYVTGFVGAVLLLVSWWGASGTTRLGSQVAWVNVGVAGLIVSGTGIALWLLHGHRAVGERQRLLLADLETAPPPDTAPASVPVGEGDAAVVAGSRMTRYHRTDCPLVAGKSVRRASRDVHERAGRRPCGMCTP